MATYEIMTCLEANGVFEMETDDLDVMNDLDVHKMNPHQPFPHLYLSTPILKKDT